MENADIKKAVIRSQHCQRNFDLNKTIPEEDMKLLETAITECPSKQNFAFYKANFITDRKTIEAIHENTEGFGVLANPDEPYSKDNVKWSTNSQTLANLLVVMEYVKPSESQEWRNSEFGDPWKRDADMAVGIAAGYLNVISSMKGYRTGCCACFNNEAVKKVLNTKNDIALMMGIGYNDDTRPRREHQSDPDFVFPTKTKETIEVAYI
jgi:nitroreductase